MVTNIAKRSVVLDGHKTSISLETEFWIALREIARLKGKTISALLTETDARRGTGNLSSNVRIFILDWYRQHQAAPPRENCNPLVP
jgi:predicted DNA-binding ribbon-helix-helix protein